MNGNAIAAILKVQRTCAAVQMPANAHADDSAYGAGWRCNRGFRETDNRCEKVIVPADAFFVDSNYGRGWECARGFRIVGAKCARVEIPEHAYPARFRR